METDYESVLLVVRECFVYRIPPRTAARGYRAAEWDDLGSSFLWKGRLRVISKGKSCSIRLEDGETGELFAVCPYEIQGNSVEGVLDSSRYFVLKIEHEGRHAFIGMGFQERSDAFDFNVALQDFAKQLRAEEAAENRAVHGSDAPKQDYSLKEGQTINITIGNVGGKRSRPRPAANASNSNTGFVPLIPPPPSAQQVKQQQQQQRQHPF
ncbi:adaptin ear-binding coat-associated protein 1 [Radiomyces spectabilis]|uniref:adaptin ear-binding coat-associated protein 1 n=1 Tax=Radiomyces spectabilis TaxID=64574 RepID=UPI00221EF56A|nr:adaptin ear-binding coat-associated protein 1 [Radiomyces spectabilis]KAI8388793.1 adaptin ear-binding coat-associated protein 1 [Radiomyces spectabilis]